MEPDPCRHAERRGAGSRVILYRWQGQCPNFGDELNTLLWPALLPDFFDQDPTTRFLGIGSVLDRRHPPDPIKLVAGAGYGGYEPRPRLQENFIIHWVRGPRTAATLGLPATLGLGDPASLLPFATEISAGGGSAIGFMPHFESAALGAWSKAAALAGLRLIDPREPPRAVADAIADCRMILSEALHGAIVADALRVPWIAIRPRMAIHRAKWHDWADTLGLRIRFHPLPASGHAEVAAVGLGRWHHGRKWMERNADRLRAIPAERLLQRAADALRHHAAEPPQLSADCALMRCQARMLQALQALRRGPFHPQQGFGARSRLQHRNDSAYQPEMIH
jgi:succinoglycan biosynthesis protein ExoV